ncbi:hypothetical protein HY639_01940 [Candidatus Woesearchaeota archaeon]|nr:hypothetical protein [Candidatus Woesearchaeota archaeon]
MGYVEDIRKINALAEELRKHNIAGSQDEAVVKAREMLVKKTGVATVQNDEYIDLSRPGKEESKPVQDHSWKEAMAKNNEYIVNELKNFRTSMETITQEMQALRVELSQLKRQAPVQKAPESVMLAQAETPNGSNGNHGQATQATQPHPRAGNYTPNDVSVEKFFYFGRK